MTKNVIDVYSNLERCLDLTKKDVSALKRLNITTFRDFCFYFPTSYQDKRQTTPLEKVTQEKECWFSGIVAKIEKKQGRFSRQVKVQIVDETSELFVYFFNLTPYQLKKFQPHKRLFAWGKLRDKNIVMHPDFEILEAHESENWQPLDPVYPLVRGLTLKRIRHLSKTIMKHLKAESFYDNYLTPSFSNICLNYIFQSIHNPDYRVIKEVLDQKSALWRTLLLAEASIHAFEINQLRQRNTAPIVERKMNNYYRCLKDLSFHLTASQEKVLEELLRDLFTQKSMQRILIGDVGSGKTIVALLLALVVMDNNLQVVIMAPTQVLAMQHFENFKTYLKPFNKQIALLTSSVKNKEKKQILEGIAAHEIQCIIGTHSLFQDAINYPNLGLVIIDEQHRFGVSQRYNMIKKVQKSNAHYLMMTATPIPRTLMMIEQKYLDVSVIDEMPKNRKQTKIYTISNAKKENLIARLHAKQKNKREKIFWVCSLIKENTQKQTQKESLESILPKLKEHFDASQIGVLHGKMSDTDKISTLENFEKNTFNVLVSTTVIEVGIDIPDANIMIIENAQHLGLAQLHQLRGRVGRREEQGVCILLYQEPLQDNNRKRLAFLKTIHSGFELAKLDLKMRGSGSVVGEKQTGFSWLKSSSDPFAFNAIQPFLKEGVECIERYTTKEIQSIKKFWFDEGDVDYDQYL